MGKNQPLKPLMMRLVMLSMDRDMGMDGWGLGSVLIYAVCL